MYLERNITGASICSFLAKISSTLPMLVAIPLAISIYGPRLAGSWITINSLGVFLSFCCQSGNRSLTVEINKYVNSIDNLSVKKSISSCYFLALILGIIQALILLFVNNMLDYELIFGLTKLELSELRYLSILLIFYYAFLPFLSIGSDVRLAVNESHLASTWQIFGNLINIFGIWLMASPGSRMIFFVMATFAGTCIAHLLNNFFLFRKRHGISPTIRHVSLNSIKTLLGSGFCYFYLATVAMLNTCSNNVIITWAIGVDQVIWYEIGFRLFTMAMFMSYVFQPLWSVIDGAIGCDEYTALRKMFFAGVVKTLLASIGFAVLLIMFGNDIIALWAGKQVHMERIMFIAFGIWYVSTNVSMFVGAFLEHEKSIKFVMITISITTLVSLVAKTLACAYCGLAPMIAIGGITQLVFCLIPYCIYLWRKLL